MAFRWKSNGWYSEKSASPVAKNKQEHTQTKATTPTVVAPPYKNISHKLYGTRTNDCSCFTTFLLTMSFASIVTV